jgi:hypothetical protein
VDDGIWFGVCCLGPETGTVSAVFPQAIMHKADILWCGEIYFVVPTLALRVLLTGFFVGKEENFREIGRDQVWNQGKEWIECGGKHAKNY